VNLDHDVPWDVTGGLVDRLKIRVGVGGTLPAGMGLSARVLASGFSGLACLMHHAYDLGILKSTQAKVPIISVGNLTTGGTGKTPFTFYLARKLSACGLTPVILSRGYGGSGGINEEAKEAAERIPDIPVLQGKKRAQLVPEAIGTHHADVMILDDGFQHLALKRDLDIVLVDATCAWGNGRLLPAGSLREPPAALARAQVAVITRADLAGPAPVQALSQEIFAHHPEITLIHACFVPKCLHVMEPQDEAVPIQENDPTLISQKTVIGVAGIGNPVAFQKILGKLNAKVARMMVFADHRDYQPSDVQRIREAAEKTHAEMIVTTDKDMVKLRHLAGNLPIPLAALEVTVALTLEDEKQLLSLLHKVCSIAGENGGKM